MQKSFSSQIAHIFSIITHPVFIPFLVISAFLYSSNVQLHPKLVALVYMVVAIGTFLLPLALVVFFMRMGAVTSLYMNKAEDRRIPFTMSSLSYYFTAKALQKLPLPHEIHFFFLGSALIIFLLMLCLRWSKISAHLAGMGGLLASLAYLSHLGIVSPYLVFICLIIVASTAWARIELKAHTLPELILGFLIGFTCVFAFINIGSKPFSG